MGGEGLEKVEADRSRASRTEKDRKRKGGERPAGHTWEWGASSPL